MNLRPYLLPSALAFLACSVGLAAKAPGPSPTHKKKRTPNYAQDVAPILYKKCAVCHHAGEVTPFNLTSYADARSKAPTLAAAVESKYMPPWQAVSHGQFLNERTLTPQQIETIQEWASAGAPEGDMRLAPAVPRFTPGWLIGQPDFIGKPDQPYHISAEGNDDYRCFVIHTDFPEGRYVTGVEVRPGNRRVVHHVLLYLDSNGVARKIQSKDGEPGYASFGGPGFLPTGSLGGWAPGLQPQVLPPGHGFWLPKGTDIVIQVHYHKDGKPETDLTQVGLDFAKAPIDKPVRWGSVHNVLIRIPAGDSHFELTGKTEIRRAVTLLDVIPHMHLLGHDMTVTATFPDGHKQELIHVEPYDFNWQTRYSYRQPVDLPGGTVLNLVAHYDNSSNNPKNPNNPPKTVTFGEQTTDEMCFAFFSYTFDDEHAGNKSPQVDDMQLGHDSLSVEQIFRHFDENHDGYLEENELVDFFKFVDQIRDVGDKRPPEQKAKLVEAFLAKQKGKLTVDEFKKMLTLGAAGK